MTIHAPKITLAALCILLFPAALAAQSTWYVDNDAPLGGDGLSWNTAYQYLQDALIPAAAGDEIRVAGGTYTPDMDEAGNVTPGDRTATFQLRIGVAIYGGYAGLADPANPDTRDIDAFISFLSGDLAVPGDSYHVVTASGTDDSAILDGVCITSGSATVYPESGGGVINNGGHATFNRCDFTDSDAYEGGAVYNSGGAHPTFTDCDFEGNSADNGGAMLNVGASPTLLRCTFTDNLGALDAAGAVYNKSGGAPQFIECTFVQNRAEWAGAVLNSSSSSPVFIDCTFDANRAHETCGAVLNSSSDAAFYGCLFTDPGTTTNEYGGAVCNSSGSPSFLDCTFEGFRSEEGGAVSNGTGASPSFIRCLFESNTSRWAGGAMRNNQSTVSLTDCMFNDNNVEYGGGGALWQSGGILQADRCVFTGNSMYKPASAGGGALHLLGGAHTVVTNSLFSGNVADESYGGVLRFETGQGTFTNCTFSHNTAALGGAIYKEYTEGDLTLTNCIVWNNPADGGGQFRAYPVITYSCVQGGYSGIGNIDADPLFIDDDGPDDIAGTEDDNLRLQSGSPAIDAADNNADIDAYSPGFQPLPPTDLDNKGRIADGDSNGLAVVDMGAYEYQFDCNGNGVDDALDIAAGTSSDCNANSTPDECEAYSDCNSNGVMDACDISAATSVDCNNNVVPDECELTTGEATDCNANGTLDECDIAQGTSADCNDTDHPDECELAAGSSFDCNANRVPDECDLALGTSQDCNDTGVPDECDVTTGMSDDCNSDGFPDECTMTGPLPGFALNVDPGGDFVRIPSSSSLRPPNDFTIEAWVNVRSLGDNQFIIDHENDGGGNDGFYLLVSPSGQARFGARNDNGGTAQSVFSAQYLDLGRWHHVAGSYDNSTLNVYVDGQQTSKPASGNVVYDALDFVFVARQGHTDSGHFNGLIDEVRIWNVVRGPADIQSAMYQTLAGDVPGLVGYWRFDEGAGTVAFDSAGDQDGVLIDNPLWESIVADCNANQLFDACETPAFADFTADGLVTLADHAEFVECLAGPDAPPANTTCAALCLAAFDCDADDDIDLFDFACFTTAFDHD